MRRTKCSPIRVNTLRSTICPAPARPAAEVPCSSTGPEATRRAFGRTATHAAPAVAMGRPQTRSTRPGDSFWPVRGTRRAPGTCSARPVLAARCSRLSKFWQRRVVHNDPWDATGYACPTVAIDGNHLSLLGQGGDEFVEALLHDLYFGEPGACCRREGPQGALEIVEHLGCRSTAEISFSSRARSSKKRMARFLARHSSRSITSAGAGS